CFCCCLSCVICCLRESDVSGDQTSTSGSRGGVGELLYGTYAPPTVTDEGEVQDKTTSSQSSPALV
ncbi:unnamed protein product, partial [Choristocarpus tenellus]